MSGDDPAECYKKIRDRYEPVIEELAQQCRPSFYEQYVPFRACALVPECDALATLTDLQEEKKGTPWTEIDEAEKQTWKAFETYSPE